MPASKGGRTLQDCYDFLGASVKRKAPGESLSSSKRQRILQGQLPMVLASSSVARWTSAATAKKSEKASDKDKQDSSEPELSLDKVTVDTIKHIEEEKRQVQQEMERIEEKRKAFFSKQSDLIGVYMYGLKKISKLTDVRDAPDAILPNNQV